METSIFVHGGPGLREYLRPRFESLIPGSYFYEQSSRSCQIEDYVQELSNHVKQLPESHLVGHSWGGVVALEYLKTQNPTSILSLSLISVPLSFRCNQDFQDACVAKNLTNPSLEQIFLSPLEEKSVEIKNELTKIFTNFNAEALAQTASYFQQFDHLDFLLNCKIPVQLISGTEDLRVPFAKTKMDAKKLRLPLHEIQGAGHFPFLYERDSRTVADALLRFFKDHKNSRT